MTLCPWKLCQYCGFIHKPIELPNIIIALSNNVARYKNNLIIWKYMCTYKIYHYLYIKYHKSLIPYNLSHRLWIYDKKLRINYMMIQSMLISDINKNIKNIFIDILSIHYCTNDGVLLI